MMRDRQQALWGPLFVLMSTLLSLTFGVAHGASFVPKDFGQLVAEAEQLFIGTVMETQSRKLPNGGIVTDITFGELRVLKGAAAEPIMLEVLGGTVGDETLELPGIPIFQVGVRYLVFSKGSGTTIFPVVGGDQGMFQVVRDPATGAEMVLNANGKPITSPSVRQAMAGSVASLQDPQQPPGPVPLDAFIQAISERLKR
jgi:hypothetical protein